MKPDNANGHDGHAATARSQDFIVLTTQRTGSSWLMDLMNGVPGVEGHMELFYHLPRQEPARAGNNTWPRFVESRQTTAQGTRPFATFRYLRRFYADGPARGFKLMYSQLREYPEILPWLVKHRLPIIHLVRQNHLDVVISEELANRVGSSHATREEGSGVATTLRLDERELCSRIRRLEKKQHVMRRLLHVLPSRVLEVHYETLRDRQALTLDNICRFLHIRETLSSVPESTLVKRQRASHAEAIENFDVVRDTLKRAGYSHLLRQ